nr:30S ribosomal protein S31, chloroplastic [Tanacetum cinerariifolium]
MTSSNLNPSSINKIVDTDKLTLIKPNYLVNRRANSSYLVDKTAPRAPAMASMAVGVTTVPMISSSNSLSFSRSPSVTSVPISQSSSTSMSLSSTSISPLIYCGRGDKKTAKGKRFNHSFGNARPRNKKKGRGPPRVPVPPAPPRKDKFDDGEVVKIEIDESIFSN